MLIEPYDRWKCYSARELPHRKEITNPRLLDLIRREPYYAAVERLVDIPTADLSEVIYKAKEGDTASTIKSRYFPEWFFCPKCRELHRIKDWEQKWQDTFGENNSSFKGNSPACYHCSSKDNKGKYHRKYLQQIRFVMASLDTAQLTDIPFEVLWDMPNDGKAWIFNQSNNVATDLSYHTSQGGDGLQSVFIKKGDGNNASIKRMSTIYDKYLVFKQDTTIRCNGYEVTIKMGAYRVVLRNGTNLYFPNIMSCIYIPRPGNDQVKAVRNLHEQGLDVEAIFNTIGRALGLSRMQIEDIIGNRNGDENQDLRMGEFNYITNPANYKNNNHRCETDFHAIRYPNLKSKHVKGIYALTQLKETSVLLNYKRISNAEKRWWSIVQNEEATIKPGSDFPFTRKPPFMPAVEAYGEGLLFELDSSGIPADKCLLFIHTFCHLIMKELEFSCGYPVTSLKEHIYLDEDNENMGFIIYTIQGAEGSYGGLTSLMPSDTNSDGSQGDAQILKLIDMAVERAKDCPNDPICSSEAGHCFACVDLPETSCEKFNDSLNRMEFLKCY